MTDAEAYRFLSGLHRRLRACLVHIGLDAMAYSAFRARWDDLARTADRVSELTW